MCCRRALRYGFWALLIAAFALEPAVFANENDPDSPVTEPSVPEESGAAVAEEQAATSEQPKSELFAGAEDPPAEADAEPTPSIKEAENIDLKKVVVEPLATPAATPEPSADEESVPREQPTAEVSESPEPEAEEPEQTPLIMLDSAVPPGTSTRLSWLPNVSFMGISAPTPVLVVHGAQPGPTLCLTAAIHGDELNGIEVVRRVLYSIDPTELKGTVIGVPIVNLQGFRRSSRYLPDRRDLNRYFPGNEHGSSASRIAYSFFEGVIRHCDLLVDTHTGSFHRTNLPQLRANLLVPEVAEITRQMGSIVVVHSEGAQGCLRRATVEAGIPAVTLEAGQPHQLQKSAVNHGVKSVETLMDSLDMLDRRPFWKFKAEPVFYESYWVRATAGGILFSDVELGDSVSEGETLGVITDPITNARQELISPFDGRVIGMALNQVMYPGFAAYHIGLQSSVEQVGEEEPEAGTSLEAGDTSPDPATEETPEVDELDERLLEDS